VSELQRLQAEHAERDNLLRELMQRPDAGGHSEPEEDGNRRKIEGPR